MNPKPIIAAGMVLLLGMGMSWARQRGRSDEGGHILALDNSWNRALETKDTKALDLLLADTFVSVDIDGSMETKRQFLTGIKAPDYHPSQAVTEQSTVEVYGDSAVVAGVFRSKGCGQRQDLCAPRALCRYLGENQRLVEVCRVSYGSDSSQAILGLKQRACCACQSSTHASPSQTHPSVRSAADTRVSRSETWHLSPARG
jgi:ketosteroid isomerase-like protein